MVTAFILLDGFMRSKKGDIKAYLLIQLWGKIPFSTSLNFIGGF